MSKLQTKHCEYVWKANKHKTVLLAEIGTADTTNMHNRADN